MFTAHTHITGYINQSVPAARQILPMSPHNPSKGNAVRARVCYATGQAIETQAPSRELQTVPQTSNRTSRASVLATSLAYDAEVPFQHRAVFSGRACCKQPTLENKLRQRELAMVPM